MKPRKELEAEYKKLARRADDRLRSLEVYSRRPGYKAIKDYSYASALKDIKRFGGKKRFGTGKSAMPKSDRKLMAKINAINKFLGAPTSTLGGINKIYKNRAESLNSQYGTKFTWQSLAKFFESGYFDKLNEKLITSDDVFNVVAEIHKNSEEIITAITESEGKNIKLKGNKRILQRNINKLLNDEEGKEILNVLLGQQTETKKD